MGQEATDIGTAPADVQTGRPKSDRPLDAVARRRNVRGVFAVRAGAVLPEHVAILDDVMIAGAAQAERSRVLKRAGVARGDDVWALARAPSPRG